MSSGIQTAVVAVVCILGGGFAGAYGTRVLYGEAAPSLKAQPDERKSCPPCPDCPACPAPPVCGNVLSGEPPPSAVLAPESDLPQAPSQAGLPVRAVREAEQALARSIATCLENAAGTNGVLILSMSLTSSAGTARFADILVTERRRLDSDTAVERCVLEQTAQVEFEWNGEDGRQELLYPVRIGP